MTADGLIQDLFTKTVLIVYRFQSGKITLLYRMNYNGLIVQMTDAVLEESL